MKDRNKVKDGDLHVSQVLNNLLRLRFFIR
jgi:hypothetical protein